MSASAPVKEGDVLADKFRVDKVVGAGGMGVVVEATHLALHQRVALKFLNEQAAQIPAVLARFEREARAAASLKSKHAVRIMDVGTMADNQPYIVMELLEGQDLASTIRRNGPMGVETAIDYLRQACDAIGEAHERGIVHRDLKPGNLFITTDNHGEPLVKVLDFGISKVAGDDLTLTSTSELLGSPLYMSPEQLRASRDVDARTDVWSLGVILYEMLAGKVPFTADSMLELLLKIVETTPDPITSLRDDVPPYVLRALEGCLVKEREQRIGSIGELLLMLKPDAPAEWPSASNAAPSRPSPAGEVATAATVREGRTPVAPSPSDDEQPGTPAGASTNGGISGPVSPPGRGRVALVVGLMAAVALVGLGWATTKGREPEPPAGLVEPSAAAAAPSAAPTEVAPPAASSPSTSPAASVATGSADDAGPAPPATTPPSVAPSGRPAVKHAPDCNPPIYYDPVTGRKKVKPGC